MKLRLAALGLGIVSGFVFARARMTDPDTFHSMLSLDSPRIYLLMGAAVAVAAGILCGVTLQPRLARAAEQMTRSRDSALPGVQGAEVL